MDVTEVAPVDPVENGSGQRGAEVPMEGRHGPILDGAQPTRTHGEFVTFPELLNKETELPEVIRTVGITHHDIASSDERESIDVRSTQSTFRGAQHPGPCCDRQFGGSI